jgi:hypothetical protein
MAIMSPKPVKASRERPEGKARHGRIWSVLLRQRLRYSPAVIVTLMIAAIAFLVLLKWQRLWP